MTNRKLPLIPTKLLPPESTGSIIHRERVIQKLINKNKQVNIICAGPGYGKTELATAFVKENVGEFLWYTVDSFDNDERIFVAHLTTALKRLFPGLRFSKQVSSENSLSRYQFISQVINAIEKKDDSFLLVIDNYQEIETSSPTWTLIDQLLNYASPKLQLLIVSQTMPTHRHILRMQSRDKVQIITTADLLFTERDIQDLYRLRTHTSLAKGIAEQLLAYTGGWPLSVSLILNSLRDNFSNLHPGESEQQLDSYIKNHILKKHPCRVNNFLRETAIFGQFSLTDLQTILDYKDAEKLLAYIKTHHLFLHRLEDQTYGYHPQIRDILRQDMATTAPDHYAKLNQKLAKHFEAEDQLSKALEHYQQANNGEGISRILENLTRELLYGQQSDSLHKWLECFPVQGQIIHPKFWLYRAQLQARTGQPAKALASLSEAQRLLKKDKQPRYALNLSAQTGLIYLQYGDYLKANHFYRQAKLLCYHHSISSPEFDLLQGSVLAISDNRLTAIEACQKALYNFEIQGDLFGQAQSINRLAELSIDTGRLTTANTLLSQGQQIARQLDRFSPLDIEHVAATARRLWIGGDCTQAQNLLARCSENIEAQNFSSLFLIPILHLRGVIYRDCDDFALAQHYFEAALAVAESHQTQLLKASLVQDMAWLQCRSGHLPAARALIQQAQQLVIHANLGQTARIRHLLGIMAHDEDKPQDALLHFEAAKELFTTLDFELNLCSCNLYLTQAYFDLGYEDQATNCLEEALVFARKNDINRFDFWDPARLGLLLIAAIYRGIEPRYATYLAAKLVPYLTLENIRVLQHSDKPEVTLPYIHLLRAMGSDEAQSLLEEILEKSTVSQIREQAARSLSDLGKTAPQTGSAAPEIRIYCLGRLRVERNSFPIEGSAWAGKSKAGRQKVKALLSFLIERDSQGATKDELVEALWGYDMRGRDETSFEGSLARTLSALRQVLEPDLVPPATSSFILNEEGRYYLNRALCWLDVDEFQGLIQRARNAQLRGEHDIAQLNLKEALSLYRDEYLRDIPYAEEWAGLQRYALSQQLGVAIMSLGNYFLEQNAVNEAITCYKNAIELEPANHTAHYHLIDALRLQGRYEDAMSAYHNCRKIFEQEVDEQPPVMITEIYNRLQAEIVNRQRSSSNNGKKPSVASNLSTVTG